MCTYTVELDLKFERETLYAISEFCVPLHELKTHNERCFEYQTRTVTPDLMFADRGRVFHVDCHWRSCPKDIMELEYPGEAAIKKECLKDVRFPVLVALGIGGVPWYPDHFACSRLTWSLTTA